MAPKCNHAIFDQTCKSCSALQKEWYGKAKSSGFKDIEYGLENPKMLYQPVDISQISERKVAFYDAVWSVYHAWAAEGRKERDLVVCELYAQQYESTGTRRGIASILKERDLKPSGDQSVRFTLNEINALVRVYLETEKIPPSPKSKLRK